MGRRPGTDAGGPRPGRGQCACAHVCIFMPPQTLMLYAPSCGLRGGGGARPHGCIERAAPTSSTGHPWPLRRRPSVGAARTAHGREPRAPPGPSDELRQVGSLTRRGLCVARPSLLVAARSVPSLWAGLGGGAPKIVHHDEEHILRPLGRRRGGWRGRGRRRGASRAQHTRRDALLGRRLTCARRVFFVGTLRSVALRRGRAQQRRCGIGLGACVALTHPKSCRPGG